MSRSHAFGPRKGARKKPAINIDQFQAMEKNLDLDA